MLRKNLTLKELRKYCAHELKTDPDVFYDVRDDQKRFELRLNDRDFKQGDMLLLRCTKYSGGEMIAGKPLEYTGEWVVACATYVLHGPIYGLDDEWVIMSISVEGDGNCGKSTD